MPVHAATDWKVVINGVTLSAFAHDVAIDDEKEQLDASGFNPTNSRTYVPGSRDQTVTIQFRQSYGAGEPFNVLRLLYENNTNFGFYVQPDSDTATTTTNPIFGGTANVYQLPVGASLNEVEEFEVVLRPATNSVWNWGTVTY
jgi:hypothetical protein